MTTEITRLRAALEAARKAIISLAEQQAMPDDFWLGVVEQIDEALAAPADAVGRCIFCEGPLGDDPIMDENGEQACRECGLAEFKTQVLGAADELEAIDADEERAYHASGGQDCNYERFRQAVDKVVQAARVLKAKQVRS